MTSSSLDKRRRTYVRLVGKIQNALNQALAEEHEKRNLTRTGMATVLGTNKSFVTRKMNGTSNMTLETLADLAFALDRVVNIELLSRAQMAGSNIGPGMAVSTTPFQNWSTGTAIATTATETPTKQITESPIVDTASSPVKSLVLTQ